MIIQHEEQDKRWKRWEKGIGDHQVQVRHMGLTEVERREERQRWGGQDTNKGWKKDPVVTVICASHPHQLAINFFFSLKVYH